MKETWIQFIHQLQDEICDAIQRTDGKAVFKEDVWEREEGGGGITRIINNGNAIEKGAVNTSVVFGDVTEVMRTQLKADGVRWFACGISLIMHPVNPFVPTVHCNYRMFELYDDNDVLTDRWFGGGTDLTPFYLFEEDAVHFHSAYKKVCDHFDPGFYSAFKKNCDDYFVNVHRNNERRGIGGIFYDNQKPSVEKDVTFWMDFGRACGNAFLPSWLTLVEKRKDTTFDDNHKKWQEIRRGRYVEFNLLHDRGTIFGLKTKGRTESILASLPPTVRFEYDHQVLPGSEEEKLLRVCIEPVDWV